MLSTTLSETIPFLFSRFLAPNATVREVFQTMLRANLRDRLTQAAVAELQELTNCMAQVAITSEDDTRLSPPVALTLSSNLLMTRTLTP